MACFVETVYLAERIHKPMDTKSAIVSQWCSYFNYRFAKTLIDQSDNTIFGAMLEWDNSSCDSSPHFTRPTSAPKVVVGLRGTMIRFST